MAQVLTSVSGIQISAASAGYSPTNSGDVSAIASGYQVVSSTAGDGTYVTSINGMGISGQGGGGAQVVTATGSASAMEGWWPPFTTSYLVSSINGSALLPYGFSALSGKSANWNSVYNTVSSNSASWGAGASLPITGSAGDVTATYEVEFLSFVRNDTAGEPDIRTASLGTDQLYIDYTLDGIDHTSMSLTESMLDFGDSDGDHIVDAYSIDSWNSAVNTVANNSASWGGGASQATVSAIASSYAGSAASSKQDSSAMSAYALSSDVSGVIDTVSSNSASWAGGGGDVFPVEYNSGSCSASLETGYFVSTRRPSLILSSTGTGIYPRVIVRNGTGTASKGSYYLNDAFEFTTGDADGSGAKVLRVDPQQVSSKNFLLFGPSGSNTYGMLALRGVNDRAYINIGSGTVEHVNYVRPSSISSWWAVHDTVSANSASWAGGGAQVVTATGSASGVVPGVCLTSVNDVHISAYTARKAESAMYASMDSNGRSISACIDTVSANSASWAASGGDVYISGFGYNDTAISSIEGSALYDKSAHARITTVAGRVTNVSAAVSGTVDLVSTQSANWGGSALALSAGPGITLTKSGNTLVAGLDETLLWSGEIGVEGDTATLIESIEHFQYITIYANPVYAGADNVVSKFETRSGLNACKFGTWSQDGASTYFANYIINLSGTSAGIIRAKRITINNSNGAITVTPNTITGTYMAPVRKIVGLNRTAGV